ncbi:hypothetical protein E4U41_001967 [Claviceps citrina]|nr:hypothetical protein E4U41_001967 [Claviceps citrina]
MFTQPVPPPPPGPQTASIVSPSRPSRLRGLSYLRNYTHSHLLSRDSHHQSNNNLSPRTAAQGQGGSLARSFSFTPSSRSAASQNPNHLTLDTSSPDATPTGDGNRVASSQAAASTPQPTSGISDVASPITQSAGLNGLPAPSPRSAQDLSGMTPTRPRAVSSGNAPSDTAGALPATTNVVAINGSADSAPSIRFSAYYDPRSTRQSLSFPPVTRRLANSTDVIRVGRYSERDGQSPNVQSTQPSSAPVGFKSKVVSRRHCEFWCEDGKWYIKDVKSSSGTFLNHIRLSPPSQESKAYPVNDGDIVQLGIDFKGGEDVIFRCVKMRLELNRGWQNKLNTFK